MDKPKTKSAVKAAKHRRAHPLISKYQSICRDYKMAGAALPLQFSTVSRFEEWAANYDIHPHGKLTAFDECGLRLVSPFNFIYTETLDQAKANGHATRHSVGYYKKEFSNGRKD